MVQKFLGCRLTVDEDRRFKIGFMGPEAQIVAAHYGDVFIDEDQFGMQSSAFAGKSGLEIRVFEIANNEHIVGLVGIFGKITIQQQADVNATLSSAPERVKKVVYGIAGFAAIIFGGIGTQRNRVSGAVEHLDAR